MQVPIEQAIADQRKMLGMATVPPPNKEQIRRNISILENLKKNGVKYVEVKSQ